MTSIDALIILMNEAIKPDLVAEKIADSWIYVRGTKGPLGDPNVRYAIEIVGGEIRVVGHPPLKHSRMYLGDPNLMEKLAILKAPVPGLPNGTE